MEKEWKDVDWKSLADKLKGAILESKDDVITVRTEEIAKSIGKSDAPLGATFWFSFVNLFDEGIVLRPIVFQEEKEIAIQFRIRPAEATWKSLYDFAIEIEKLKDLKTGIELLLEEFY